MNTPSTSAGLRLSHLSLAIAVLAPFDPVLSQDTHLGPVTVEAPLESVPGLGETAVEAGTLDFLRAQTNDTARLLRDTPGLSLNHAGGVSSLPSIRGLADDRLRIQVDGMDFIASCPNHMNPPLSYVDPSNIRTLKVFSGVTPVSVGGDSIGGTIIAETVAPAFAVPGEGVLSTGGIGTSYRSNNDAYSVSASATQATDTFSIRYSGSWSQADNYTAGDGFKESKETGRPGHTLSVDEVGSTAYETQNHILGIAYKTGSDLFDLQFGYQNMPHQLYPNQRMDLLDNEQKRVNLGWSSGFDWGDLEVRAYHEEVDHAMDFGPDKRLWYGSESQPPFAAEVGTPCSPIGPMTCAEGMPMYAEGRTSGATVKAEVDLSSDDLLRLGLEYQRYRLDDYWEPSGGRMWPGTFQNIDNGKRDRKAVFAEWESEIGAGWLSLLGVRYERVEMDAGGVEGYANVSGPPTFQADDAAAFNASDRDKTDNNWDLTALARYRHDANLDVELGVARKVRSPNLYERYTWSTWTMAAVMNNFVGDGNGYVGDVDLESEKAYTASVTLDWHAADRSWAFRIAPYYTHVDDYIDAVAFNPATFQADRFNVLQYKNQSARLHGIDLAGEMRLDRNTWGDWGLRGLVSYTKGKNRDTDDSLYNIMPLNGRFTLTHRLHGWNNALELVLVDEKDHGSNVRNEIETSGYGLINLRASHSWRQVRVDFGVENLFDKFYYLPTGGAYLGQGSTMQVGGVDWGTAVPGMGRSIYAGVNVTF